MSRADLLVDIAGHGLYPSTRRFAEGPLRLRCLGRAVGRTRQGVAPRSSPESAADAGALPVTDVQRKDLREHTRAAEARRDAAATVHRRDRLRPRPPCHRDAASSGEPPPRRSTTNPRPCGSTSPSTCSSRPSTRRRAESVLEEQGILLPGEQRSWSRASTPGHPHVEERGSRQDPLRVRSEGHRRSRLRAATCSPTGSAFTPRSGSVCGARHGGAAPRGLRPGAGRPARAPARPARRGPAPLREDLASGGWSGSPRPGGSRRSWPRPSTSAWETFSVPDVVPISAWSRAYRPHRARSAAPRGRTRHRSATRGLPDVSQNRCPGPRDPAERTGSDIQ